MILKDDLLLNTTEKQIMEFYWGEHLSENKPHYKNPMRADTNGTCYFRWYGAKYIFVDHARGFDANFDCFKYVMWLYGCNFYEVLIRINNDMVLKATSKVLKQHVRSSTKVKSIKIETNFKIKVRNWNQNDIDYWDQYHISIDNVSKIARPVDSYMSNAGSCTFQLKYKYNSADPCYVYLFDKSKRVKLYQPYSDYNKWKSNSKANDVFGYELLPHFGDDLYITSGGKDMLCMWEMGYDSVAPQSESTPIPEHVMKDLKARFKNIYYLYDNDTTGIKMSIRFAEQNKVNNIILPYNDMQQYKDVADYCKGIGLINTIKIIDNVKRQSKGIESSTNSSSTRSTRSNRSSFRIDQRANHGEYES